MVKMTTSSNNQSFRLRGYLPALGGLYLLLTRGAQVIVADVVEPGADIYFTFLVCPIPTVVRCPTPQ